MSTLNRLNLIVLLIVHRASWFEAERLIKKALYLPVSAFFITCLFVPPLQADNGCSMKGNVEEVTWSYIVDGDTLWLKDGRKVRFASINAPEAGHDGIEAQPFGDEATEVLRVLLRKTNRIMLQKAGRGEDQHGRMLANLFLPDGQSIEALLLRQGMAYQLFSDDLSPYNTCLFKQEEAARTAGLGVWSVNPLLDINKQPVTAGFQIVRGTVVSVRAPRNSDYFWVDMDGPLVLRVLKNSGEEQWLRNMIGQKVEARGWISKSNKARRSSKKYKPWVMGIYHFMSIKRT